MPKTLARETKIMVPPEKELGPAMRAITANQRAFVIAMVEIGARNNTQAAMMAGYGGNENAARVAAKDLMRNPRVLEAIREEADKRLRSGALMAASRLIEIASDPKDKYSFKACVELLNRAELIVATKHEVTVHDNRTPDEIVRRIHELAQKNGIDPTKLLGHTPEVKDAEFKEVDPTDGLEDILG